MFHDEEIQEGDGVLVYDAITASHVWLTVAEVLEGPRRMIRTTSFDFHFSASLVVDHAPAERSESHVN